MKLIEALEIAKVRPTGKTSPFEIFLVSGFTPLHLQTFLVAELISRNKDLSVQISTGLYSDMRGNLERMAVSGSSAASVVLEWGDFDGRLGTRGLGRWNSDAATEILDNSRNFAGFLANLLKNMPRKFPVSLSSPSLLLPPVSHMPSWQASHFELSLRECVASLLKEISTLENVRIVSDDRLAMSSPFGKRLDLKSEYSTGFPYQLSHASEVARLHANLIYGPSPKKGLITDLDDTLWLGILGDLGVSDISWDLEHHAHGHGSYQRFLQSLSEAGVLLAAASKNDHQNVQAAFQRPDLLVDSAVFYPLEANWGPKSESVARIMKTWNVSADSVVFVDDSPMELAEVKEAHPEIECILFPKNDPGAMLALQYRLRDLFGKRTITAEDALRQQSIRSATKFTAVNTSGSTSEEFLSKAGAELSLDFRSAPLDPRALELVNKTNQFNLNGRRFNEAEWQDYFQDPSAVLLLASYQDKFGPLGKISVLAGRRQGRSLVVDVWVLSCRAFSRKIEHRILQELLDRLELDNIVLRFAATPKNGPLREFVCSLIGADPAGDVRISRDYFNSRESLTHHKVLELTRG